MYPRFIYFTPNLFPFANIQVLSHSPKPIKIWVEIWYSTPPSSARSLPLPLVGYGVSATASVKDYDSCVISFLFIVSSTEQIFVCHFIPSNIVRLPSLHYAPFEDDGKQLAPIKVNCPCPVILECNEESGQWFQVLNTT